MPSHDGHEDGCVLYWPKPVSEHSYHAYDVTHTTEYDYSQSVVVAHHVARLKPRELAQQECLSHELAIAPAPAVTSTYEDYFGNLVTNVAVQGAHKSLVIRARSTVNVTGTELPQPGDTPPWEAAADRAALPFEAVEFVFDSTSSRAQFIVESYARASFPAARPLLDAVLELTGRIHEEFTFDPKATTIATPLTEVFASRRGVCQDFARLEIACLRSLGIPARYISGYMETVPPPGKAAAGWGRRLARLAGRLLPGNRLDPGRSDEQSPANRQAYHLGVGT